MATGKTVSKDMYDEDEDLKQPINDIDISNKIKKELFRQLRNKPDGFKRLEIKRISPPRSYRVNLVCLKQDDRAIFEQVYRPLSYYVICVEDGLVFSPEIVPIS